MYINTKFLLRSFCKFVFISGSGNFYYDQKIYKETFFYKMYSVVSYSIYITMILLENCAAIFGKFPEVEKNSAVMFAAIHNIVLAKMFLLLYHKNSIRKLNYEMATVMENIEEEYVMREQYRKVKFGITFYVASVYLSLVAYGVESLRKVITEGVPFYTVVTVYPSFNDISMLATLMRAFFYITWLYMMLPMMAADCMPIIHLITMAYKFMTLCHRFEAISEAFKREVKISKTHAISVLKIKFLEGIVIHQKLLMLTEEIQRVFGIIMSLQVCESSAVAVLLLLRLALSPHQDLTNAFMTYTFVCSLFILLALNLWNAGELTYQASLLSNAMFYCDWYMCDVNKDSKNIRKLVLIGCAQAQKPLILKAFGVQDLSYATFVSVARMTYSIFAVFYQRRH
ncbi:uncharacterized protein LOC125050599 [Pieris napi]|uniref:uncharacterized protein LOC125050599 n=1 Tax=Pieris napi TaxID=78633 RepID=UPI001FBAFE40|nr:uncharacterized protein LOC125050599 [Pieris napi]